MTVKFTRPSINIRETLDQLNKPSGIAGNAMLAAETPQEQFNLIGAGRKNLIINGDMQVSQRGASFTADGFSLDRWYHQLSGATSTTTQETFALGAEVSGCPHYLKQATSVGNNYCGLVYKVEDVMSIHEGKATFSFYAKGTNPAGGSFTVRLARLNTGVTFYDTPLNGTLTLTASWQRFVYTFDVATFSGMGAAGSDSKLYISIHQAAGDVSTTAWELNITGVQLETCSIATPFEHRSYGEELALCQRYYWQYLNPAAVYTFASGEFAANNHRLTIQHPVTMRSAPDIYQSFSANTEATWATSTAVSFYKGSVYRMENDTHYIKCDAEL